VQRTSFVEGDHVDVGAVDTEGPGTSQGSDMNDEDLQKVPGTAGYQASAPQLAEQYRAGSFEDKHSSEMHLLQRAPSVVLDIGAGSGSDAAWFARHGHRVVAVEPTDGLREAAAAFHSALDVRWVNDALPALEVIRSFGIRFDLITMFAVWMHLDRDERCSAMDTVAGLLADGGTVVMTLRHGPVPTGRRMFDVQAEETIQLAQKHGLTCVLNECTQSFQPLNRAAGVTWTKLAMKSREDSD
jgi:SAM-dependent methyltransferase